MHAGSAVKGTGVHSPRETGRALEAELVTVPPHGPPHAAG